MRGRVISAYGGSFKVLSESGEEFTCTARGALRAKDKSPYCGDTVETEIAAGEYVIKDILPRKNEIVRPPLANLDQIVFVSSAVSPPPNILNLDKFTAVSVFKGILPVMVFTKSDLGDAEKYVGLYRDIFPTFSVDNVTGEGAEDVKKALSGKFSALCGNSGVGKSSLLNNLIPGAGAKTGDISRKLRRGKNTTRRTDIFPLPGGGFLADTPGFAAFSTDRYDVIYKDSLQDCFPEFEQFIGKCRFNDCSHRTEQGCAILEALREGIICESRHRSYVEMYAEAEKLKPWNFKK